MACCELVWRPSAERELRRLPRQVIARLVALAESLRENPYPPGIRKLLGSQHAYRLRSGDYRLVYSVQESRLIVEVIKVGHRREIYR